MPKIEAWGDGSGGALGLTTSFVEGSVIDIEFDTELHYFADLSFDDPVAVDLKLEASYDGGVTYDELDLPIVAIRGDLATYHFKVIVPARSKIKLSLKRRGGTVDSSAYVGLVIRQQIADWDDTEPEIVNVAEAFSDGAGAAETLTTSYVYGDWFEVGYGDEIELLVTKTTANAPTTVELDVQTSLDGSTAFAPTQVESVASSLDKRASTIKQITDLNSATDPLRRSVIVQEPRPNMYARVGAQYTGGAAPDLYVTALVHRR